MKAQIKIIAAMLIWGSMGLFVRHIDMPAGEIALIRSIIGLLFLIAVSFVLKKPVSRKGLYTNRFVLLVSGALLGINWIFLFEAYKHTTIAVATLCYYLAPIIIAFVSPLIFKEKLTLLKIVLTITALIGLGLVSGIFKTSGQAEVNGIGVIFGIAAAISYASLTLISKNLKGISSMDSTIAQFGVSFMILLPYIFIDRNTMSITLSIDTIILLIVLGVFHTGVAFWLFFSAIRDLKAQTIAVFSYLDPVTAVLMSALLLKEQLVLIQIIGACMILGSAFISGYMKEK